MTLDPVLLTQATNLWGLYRRKELTYDELMARLARLEVRHGIVRQCRSCGENPMVYTDTQQCAPCRNQGKPTGDEIDRAWDEYRDHRDAIGGGNAY